jgi:transposase
LRDAGIGFGSFVAHLRNNATDKQMASDFGVGMQTIRHFRQHFEAFGIDSIVGQD